ncbi:MAG: hypothetical protein IKO27_09625 [Ruminococcus sp.]|nr:hypothetical protein [Ruminococcus sp.]
MSVDMHRSRNWFEKLAPLWAVIGMAVHTFSIWYVYFRAEGLEVIDNYQSFARYIIWAAVVLAALFSFVPDSVVSIARHTVFYLVSAAVGVGFLYWYANNRFSAEEAKARSVWVLVVSGLEEDDYVRYYLKYAILSSAGLCGAVAAFCAIKYHLSSTGWIKKHIR